MIKDVISMAIARKKSKTQSKNQERNLFTKTNKQKDLYIMDIGTMTPEGDELMKQGLGFC
jgi:hypothetical protein